MCRYESLRDGTLTLLDVARMNDELDAAAENERRIEEAREEKRSGR
jgi:hypothetical protein